MDYEGFLISLGEVLIEMASEARLKKQNAVGTDREDFCTGYLAGFHRIITLMQQHAEGYDIPLEKLGLDKIDEGDLI